MKASRDVGATGPGPRRDLSGLEDALGYRFTDIARLERALTHASATPAGGADNERLEFLGDRVLGLIVAGELIARFPSATEGELAPRFNRLVRRESCAEAARTLGLGEAIRLAPGEAAQGGRDKTAILGNAMEAVIAAVYLDGGLEAARQLVMRIWAPMIDSVSAVPRDAKTRLQERLHAAGLEPPHYRVMGQAGPDHAPIFTVEADAGPAGTAQGSGTSKRAAEQAAAAVLLGRLGDAP